MQYLSFMLDGIEFAVDVGAVETVVEAGEITPVPTPTGYLRGVMDLRGRTIAVADLRRKFGLPAADAGRGACVVVAEGYSMGALVDGVSEVVTIDRLVEEEGAAERGLWSSFVLGIARVDGRMLVVLDPKGLFQSGDRGDGGK